MRAVDDSDIKPGSVDALPTGAEERPETGPVSAPVRRAMRTSQVPTGEFDRASVSAQLVHAHGLEAPSAEEALDTAVELAHAMRPEMDDDEVVQTFVAGLCALLPGRRFVVRLLPRPPREPAGAMWTTGPVIDGAADRFRIERTILGRYGFYAEQAQRVGLEVVDRYQGEFHRAARGFHAPIFFGRMLLGVLSVEYYPGESPPSGDPRVVGQLAIQLGASLAHRHAREDSANLEEQVIQAEKLATLGQLAAGVVHELNNPLTSISAYGELLHAKLANAGADPGDTEKLRRIVQSADRILRFTRDLVTYARPSSEPPQELALREVVGQGVVFCEHLILEHGADVEIEVDTGVPTIRGVRGQLHQVLINLITNACHAMPEGAGELRIRVRTQSPRFVELWVKDNGAGIPEHLHEAIFQPFFSTKGEGKGTGLGLSIVRNIVQQHGGSIEVRSVVGEGATFVVAFPVGDPT
jgi:signal transduction histidine kinase